MTRAFNFIQTSPMVEPLQVVANGAVKAIRTGWNQTFGSINTNFTEAIGEDRPGRRTLTDGFHRSQKCISFVRNFFDEEE